VAAELVPLPKPNPAEGCDAVEPKLPNTTGGVAVGVIGFVGRGLLATLLREGAPPKKKGFEGSDVGGCAPKPNCVVTGVVVLKANGVLGGKEAGVLVVVVGGVGFMNENPEGAAVVGRFELPNPNADLLGAVVSVASVGVVVAVVVAVCAPNENREGAVCRGGLAVSPKVGALTSPNMDGLGASPKMDAGALDMSPPKEEERGGGCVFSPNLKIEGALLGTENGLLGVVSVFGAVVGVVTGVMVALV